MHPGVFAAEKPNHPAVILDDGTTTTYAELDAYANRLSRFLLDRGIGFGGNVAILLPNGADFLAVVWGAHRIGAYYTFINYHLTPDEVTYILRDCGATMLVTSAQLGDAAAYRAEAPLLADVLVVDGEAPGCVTSGILDGYSGAALDEPLEGSLMLYSSGTTGRPKGIKKALVRQPISSEFATKAFFTILGVGADSIFLTPAPLYHAAPGIVSMGLQRVGATLVLMRRFDPERCLALIQRYGITSGQFVPTMFTRLLQLDPIVRASYQVGTLKSAIHSAAPCPVEVKTAMIEWWGPIIWEYYGSSENPGITMIDAEQWLSRPGSVGKSVVGRAHILRDDGSEAAPGEIGEIYFSDGNAFTYHGDAEKTSGAYNARGWASVGDCGHLDEDGFLYLADRSNDMIISGGVNIYPREAEDALALHPLVSDIAVIGVPNPEFGEEVKGVVVPQDWSRSTEEMAEELIAFCRARIAHFKCPKSIDFVEELPRLPSGKLYRRRVREPYWAGRGSAII